MFIDESIRSDYVMAAVIVPITELGDNRRRMSSLRVRGSLAFHMKNEKRNVQAKAVDTLTSLDRLELLYSRTNETSAKGSMARRRTLEALLNSLETQHEWSIVLDRHSSNAKDAELILSIRQSKTLNLDFVHSNRYEDVGLWGSDILAWAIATKSQFSQSRIREAPNTP